MPLAHIGFVQLQVSIYNSIINTCWKLLDVSATHYNYKRRPNTISTSNSTTAKPHQWNKCCETLSVINTTTPVIERAVVSYFFRFVIAFPQ